MAHLVDPDNPEFRAIVVAILDERMAELDKRIADVVASIRTQLDYAGYTEAAEFVQRHFGQ